MATLTVSFSLDPEQDADLVTWLSKHDRRARSAAIREKLRAGIRHNGPTLADVLAELREIKRMLRSGIVAAPVGAGQEQEDDDPASAEIWDKLKNLGL